MNKPKRNRIILLTLIILASVFIVAGFLTDYLLEMKGIASEHSFSDNSVIPPNMNTSIGFEVTANASNLRIEFAANSTLIVRVSESGNQRWKWETSELKRNLLASLDPGNWAVNFQNNNETGK